MASTTGTYDFQAKAWELAAYSLDGCPDVPHLESAIARIERLAGLIQQTIDEFIAVESDDAAQLRADNSQFGVGA
ncbi:MAG: hypothetical protein Q8R92_01070 [Deltaproteobacteria bacterium]|nr:hypothetical protein [Deltaproteobacteria bacterium]